MMALLTPEKVLALTRISLGLPVTGSPAHLDDELLAAMLRRIAGLHCPCSPATLKLVLLQTLEGVVESTEELNLRIESIINALHAGGDLLELARVTTMDERTRGTWVFVAPPSFVVLPSGLVRIFGVAPEEALPLPTGMRSRVIAVGAGRVIEPNVGEDLRAALDGAGLREQSIDSWLRVPRELSASDLRKSMDTRLRAVNRSGQIGQLRILSPAQPRQRYADRWVLPTAQTGQFVSRRPQAYGADLWGYIELENGEPKRLLDFPLSGSAYRGCDEAWRLQLALDKEDGHAQEYRVRSDHGGPILDLFFPIPIWAQRRLEVLGARMAPHQCLMSFRLPPNAMEGECDFLEKALWMKKAVN